MKDFMSNNCRSSSFKPLTQRLRFVASFALPIRKRSGSGSVAHLSPSSAGLDPSVRRTTQKRTPSTLICLVVHANSRKRRQTQDPKPSAYTGRLALANWGQNILSVMPSASILLYGTANTNRTLETQRRHFVYAS